MPRTTNSFVSFSVERTVKESPTARFRSSATLFGSSAPSAPSCVSTSSEPSSQRKSYTVGDLVVQTGEVRAVALDLRDVLPNVADGLDAVHVGDGVADGGRELGVAVLRRDDQVGLDLALDRVAVRHAQAVGENGDERHERDPDHQRGRGRGGAARVPLRVLAADPVDPRRRQHARELHRPLGLPLRHRAPHPHDEHDQREQRVECVRAGMLRRGRAAAPGPNAPCRSSQYGNVQNGQIRIITTTVSH